MQNFTPENIPTYGNVVFTLTWHEGYSMSAVL